MNGEMALHRIDDLCYDAFVASDIKIRRASTFLFKLNQNEVSIYSIMNDFVKICRTEICIVAKRDFHS